MIRRWILAVLIGGIPLFFLRITNDPINVPKFALLILGVSLVGVFSVIEITVGGDPTGLRRLLVPAGVLAGAFLVSWFFATERGWSLFGAYGRFQGLVPYLLVIVLGVFAADAFAHAPLMLARSLMWSGTIVAAYAVVQAIGLDPFRWVLVGNFTDQAVSTLGNPNFTGGYLATTLSVTTGAWAALVHERNRTSKMLVVQAVGLILTFSQGPLAAAVAGTGIVIGYHFRDRGRRARLALVALPLLVTGGLVAITAIAVVRPLDERIPATIRLRGQWWLGAAKMAAARPVTGWGPNAFAIQGPNFRTEKDVALTQDDIADDPHSVPLSLLTATGILGLLATASVAWWITTRFRLQDLDALRVGFLAGFVAYAIASLVSIDELSLRVGAWACLAGLACDGIVSEKRGRKSSRKKVREASKAPLAPAVATAIVIGIGAAIVPGRLLIADRSVLVGRITSDVDTALSSFDDSRRIWDNYHYRRLLGARTAAEAIEEQDPDLFATAREAYAYTDDLPYIPAVNEYANYLRDWATLMDDRRVAEDAIAIYERLAERDPNNPAYQGQIDGLRTTFE